MIYTPMTVKAMKIAYQAHAGQVDYNGVPYVFHPYHMAEQMDDEICCTVALLHDVVEDTDVTFEDLQKEFPQEVMDAVRLLTRDEDTDYFEYVRAIRSNPIARKVKLADLAHNSDEARAAGELITEEQRIWWKKKYSKAKALLTEKDET